MDAIQWHLRELIYTSMEDPDQEEQLVSKQILRRCQLGIHRQIVDIQW